MSKEEKRIEELFHKWFEKVFAEFSKQLEEVKGKPAFRDILTRFENRYYLLVGLGFGVLFGIMGNFLATHWIELLKVLVDEKDWVLANAAAFLVSLSALLLSGMWIMRRIRSEREIIGQAWFETLKEAAEAIHVPMPEELNQLIAERQKKLLAQISTQTDAKKEGSNTKGEKQN